MVAGVQTTRVRRERRTHRGGRPERPRRSGRGSRRRRVGQRERGKGGHVDVRAALQSIDQAAIEQEVEEEYQQVFNNGLAVSYSYHPEFDSLHDPSDPAQVRRVRAKARAAALMNDRFGQILDRVMSVRSYYQLILDYVVGRSAIAPAAERPRRPKALCTPHVPLLDALETRLSESALEVTNTIRAASASTRPMHAVAKGTMTFEQCLAYCIVRCAAAGYRYVLLPYSVPAAADRNSGRSDHMNVVFLQFLQVDSVATPAATRVQCTLFEPNGRLFALVRRGLSRLQRAWAVVSEAFGAIRSSDPADHGLAEWRVDPDVRVIGGGIQSWSGRRTYTARAVRASGLAICSAISLWVFRRWATASGTKPFEAYERDAVSRLRATGASGAIEALAVKASVLAFIREVRMHVTAHSTIDAWGAKVQRDLEDADVFEDVGKGAGPREGVDCFGLTLKGHVRIHMVKRAAIEFDLIIRGTTPIELTAANRRTEPKLSPKISSRM